MKLELFYDIVSPYSYFAFHILERYRRLWSLDLVLRPAFLGGVMKAVGNVPPATLPQRAPYLLADVMRLSRYVGVPLQLPSPFPGVTLATMRFLAAVHADHGPASGDDKLPACTRHLWHRHWGEGGAVDGNDALVDAALAAGLSRADAQRLLARAAEPAIKDALKAASDEAVQRGAFGFPAMFVRNDDGSEDLYFGGDRLPVLAAERGLPWHGPVPPESG